MGGHFRNYFRSVCRALVRDEANGGIALCWLPIQNIQQDGT